MDDVPAGVEQLRTVEQPQPRLHGADAVVRERRGEPTHRPGRRDGVGIQERDDVARQRGRAGVAPPAEAEIAPGPDEAYTVALELERTAVVDDDDLVCLACEGVETPLQMVAAVVRDDDDPDGQYAPLRAITAGSVFARIEMSSQIDQFSR